MYNLCWSVLSRAHICVLYSEFFWRQVTWIFHGWRQIFTKPLWWVPLVYIVHRVPFFPPLDRRSEFSSPIFFGSPDPLNKRKIIFYSIFEIPEAFIERTHQKIVQKPSKKATKKNSSPRPDFPTPSFIFLREKTIPRGLNIIR